MFTVKISLPMWYSLILNQHMIIACSCSWSYLTSLSIHGKEVVKWSMKSPNTVEILGTFKKNNSVGTERKCGNY